MVTRCDLQKMGGFADLHMSKNCQPFKGPAVMVRPSVQLLGTSVVWWNQKRRVGRDVIPSD